jgi:pyruvate,water dikinase
VDKALRRALSRFDRNARFAVRSSAAGEDGVVSFAGQHDTRLNVPRDHVPEAWRDVVASLYSPRALEYRRTHGLAFADAVMAVGCLLMTPAVAAGVSYTVDPSDPETLDVHIAATLGLGDALVDGAVAPDRFTVSRSRPHRVLTRAIAAKHVMSAPAPDMGTEAVPVPPDVGARPALSDHQLGVIACVSLQIEQHMHGPQDIEWAIDGEGRLTVLQARPLALETRRAGRIEALGQALARHRVLLRGCGEVACRGVGAGRVRLAGPDGHAEGFEAGDVVVARYASPRLSAVAASASAVITDVGAVTGHMATVAREYRVPTIVGCGDATRQLEPGTMVTVDANSHAVYEGTVDELLRFHVL